MNDDVNVIGYIMFCIFLLLVGLSIGAGIRDWQVNDIWEKTCITKGLAHYEAQDNGSFKFVWNEGKK